jgi:hypothetical protein
VCGEVEAIPDAQQRAGFAADRPVRTRSSVYEVMSVRGLGRLIKLPHSAEERRARTEEDCGGFEDGVAAVRRTERASMRSIACCEPLAVRRTRSGVAGGWRMDSARGWKRSASASAVVAVVAELRAGATEKVVGLCCEIQSTLLLSFVDGRHCIQRVERYQISRRIAVVGRSHRSRPASGRNGWFSPAFFVPARRDNCIHQER